MAADARALGPAPGTHPVIGRSDTYEWLRSAVLRAQEGNGGTFLLLGEAGVGKSTLANAAAEEARRRSFLVLEGRALPREVPQPFEPLKEALRALGPKLQRLPDRGEGGGLRALWVPERQSPASLVPLGLMPWREREEPASATGPADDTSRRVWEAFDRAGAGFEEDRLALFDRIFVALATVAREQPVLLVLEDIQNADGLTMEFLRFVARHAKGQPLGVLLTATPLEAASAPVREVLEALGREGLLEVQRLRPLLVEEVRDYLRWLGAGKDPGEDEVTRLFAESEGNPLFLERLARGERGRLPGFEGAGAEAGGEPGTSRGSRAGRPRGSEPSTKDALEDLGRKLLVYGALLGMEFPFSAMAQLSDAEEERVALALERLVRRDILEERAEESYAFRDPLYREDVLASLTETRRRRLHRRLAEVLEVLGTGNEGEETWVRDLAIHFHLGGQPLRSFDYNCRLFDLARHVGRVAEAREALDRALEAVRRIPHPEPERRDQEREVLLKLGETLAEVGELRRSQERLMEAFQMFLPNEPHEAVQIALARTHLYQGKVQEAHRRLEQLLPPAEEAHPSSAAVEALGLTAESAMALGHIDEALTEARRALHLAESLPDLLLLAEQVRRMGDLRLLHDPDTDRARALYGRALRLFDEGGDPLGRARVEVALAEVDFRRGRAAEAFRRLEEVARWSEGTGARRLHAEALLLHAHHATNEGDLERAARAAGRARELVPPEEGPRFELRYALLEGRHAHRRGEHEKGRAHLARAHEIARATGLPDALFGVVVARAEGALLVGDREEARRLLEEARGLAREHPRLEHQLRELQRALGEP